MKILIDEFIQETDKAINLCGDWEHASELEIPYDDLCGCKTCLIMAWYPKADGAVQNNWIKSKGGDNMEKQFKIGDKIVVKSGSEGNTGCGTLNGQIRRILSEGGSYYVVIHNLTLEGGMPTRATGWRLFIAKETGEYYESSVKSCCPLIPSSFELFEQNMIDLRELTPEQKEGLSANDQALYERGVIDEKLRLQNAGYVVEFLFKQNKKEIAKQAAQEIADEKKRREKKSE